MAGKMTLVIFVVSMITLSLAQTFQYSRGWTNGKRGGRRSVLGGLPSDFDSASSGGQVAGNRIVEVPTPCDFQKLKMFLRGAAGTDQLYLLLCDIIGNSGAAPAVPDFPPVGRFRRSSAATPQENNNSY